MNKILFRTLLALFTLALTACVNEPDIIPASEGGCLQLSLSNISTAVTRTTPTVLGKPSASDFRLQIINEADVAVYDDMFTEEELTLPIGNYTARVTYGSNPELGVDKPYYIGETTEKIKIEKDAKAQASITAKVGNALVSVNFGSNAEEMARFDRFYSDYSLQVSIGNHSLSITKAEPTKSIYVRAGSHVSLKFIGKLKMDENREVSTVLESKDLPAVLNAADHAIVTLSLPDPESALGVDISKVEVETVTLDETIPLSWLPVPQATPSHHYDEQGYLMGTDLTFSNSYPGMTWKAEVTKAGSTEILRRVDGTGDLTSAYTGSEEWPYLPSGSYTAKFYLQMNGTYSQTSSRTFTIPSPKLTITLDGYTSYSKYLEEEVEEANEAGPNGEVGFYGRKIRNVSARLMVADNIINNAKYASLKNNVTAAVDGTAISGTATGQTFFLAYTGDLSRARHTISVSGTFDGGTATASKDFEVTGIPYLANSAETFNDWTAQKKGQWTSETPDNSLTAMTSSPGECYWFKGESSGESTANIYTPKFNVPSDIAISMQYDIWLYVPSSANILIGGTDYLYINYGPVPNTNTTPSSDTAKPQNTTWTTFSNNSYNFTKTISYLSWQWHYDQYIFTAWYWWGINNVKVLYREKE